MTHFLLKIGPKFSLQTGTVLFSDCWQGIGGGIDLKENFSFRSMGAGVLNYDTFCISEELQNSGKSFYGKRTWDDRISCLKMPVARPG